MAKPTSQNGGKTIAVPVAAGTRANPGDVITCLYDPSGGHVVLKPHAPPAYGYAAGYSDDFVHWSLGSS